MADVDGVIKSKVFPGLWLAITSLITGDMTNRANLGIEVMHERNAHNFPLDLAAGEAVPLAMFAPVIHG